VICHLNKREDLMVNAHRGDVPFRLGGQMHGLRLTLGGLAELEQAFGAETLGELSGKLASADFSAKHLCAVLAAGFAGAGQRVSAEDIARELPASALEEATVAAALLLGSAFGGGSPSRPPPPQAAS
jgi:hypothetical protein